KALAHRAGARTGRNLEYTINGVGAGGFEPPTSCSQSKRAAPAPRPVGRRLSFNYTGDQPGAQPRQQGAQGPPAVADPVFRLRRGLGEGHAQFIRQEERVIAEAAGAPRLFQDAPAHAALRSRPATVGKGQDDGAAELRSPPLR